MIYNADVASAAGIVQSKLALADWAAYTPAWASFGTQPALSNGTLTGRYVRLGDTVYGQVFFSAGSSTTFGTSWWTFSLPTAAQDSLSMQGSGYAENNGVTGYVVTARGTGSGDFLLVWGRNAGGGVTEYYSVNVPFAWATGDFFNVSFTYEWAAA